MTLTEAITAVEGKVTDLSNADNAKDQSQKKFDAALEAKTNADKADADAEGAFNASLDDLIAAASAAKRTPAVPTV